MRLILLIMAISISVKANRVATKPTSDISIKIVSNGKKLIKPMIRVYYETFYSEDNPLARHRDILPDSIDSNTYIFHIKNEKEVRYFSLSSDTSIKQQTLLKLYHFEPGDKVLIHITETKNDRFSLKFSGQGAAKYTVQYNMLNNMKVVNRESLKTAINVIELSKSLLSKYSYNLLKADLVGQMERWMIIRSYNTMVYNVKNLDSFRTAVLQYRQMCNGYSELLSQDILAKSIYFDKYILTKIVCDSYAKNGKIVFLECFNEIKTIPNSALRDKVMVVFFLDFWLKITDQYDQMLNEGLSLIIDEECREKLKELDRNGIGRPAFNFALPDVNDKIITLSQFRGKVVFIDFWFTGCGACSQYYKDELSVVERFYNKSDKVIFITVNVDSDKKTWLNSVNSGKYTSTEVINLFTTGQGITNDLPKYYNLSTFPKPMLVGRDGKILRFSGKEMRKSDYLIQEIEKGLNANQ
jgi:cytochrome oxidase Cu insertion factor (SCO1/SenC/PrrC family)